MLRIHPYTLGMKKLIVLLLALAASSCAGMKVMKEPPKEEPKPTGGITWGGSPVNGKFEVKKVGFWCDARHGVLTFGAFGGTEAEARVNATNTCLKMHKGGPCEVASCKAESENKPGRAPLQMEQMLERPCPKAGDLLDVADLDRPQSLSSGAAWGYYVACGGYYALMVREGKVLDTLWGSVGGPAWGSIEKCSLKGSSPDAYLLGRTLPGDGEENGTWYSIYKAKQAWKIDAEKGKFVEASAKDVTCHIFSGCGTDSQ